MPAKDVNWALMAQHAAASAAARDLRNFCQWNRMDRIAASLEKLELGEYRKAKIEGNMAAAEKILAKEASFGGPWEASMMGTEFLKSRGYDSAFHLGDNEHKTNYHPNTILAVLNTVEQENEFSLESYSSMELSPPTAEDVSRSCSYLKVKDPAECGRAVKSLTEFVDLGRIWGAMIVSKKNFERILKDPSYKNGLVLAAKQSVNELVFNQPSSGFFEGLVSSFSTNASPEEARRKAWDIMYLYAVGGPNLLKRANLQVGFSPTNLFGANSNAVAAQALVETMVKLDGKRVTEGNSVYSLPNGADFPCDSGKSYHFWMTAYFARHLRELGYSADTSAKVAYIAAVSYHLKPPELTGAAGFFFSLEGLMGDSGSERKPAAEQDYARYGSIENAMRIDLNLAAAGAVFGVGDGEKLKSISRGFQRSIQQSKPNPNGVEISPEQQYSEWLDRLNPAGIFDYYAE